MCAAELFREEILDEHIDAELGLSLEHGFIFEEVPQLFLIEGQAISHFRVDDVTRLHIVVTSHVEGGEGVVRDLVRL